MAKQSRLESRTRRHARVREKIRGSAGRPRLAVFRSIEHIYAQLIDDDSGRTLVAASSVDAKDGKGKKTERAKAVGAMLGDNAKAKGIEDAKKQGMLGPLVDRTIPHQVVADFGAARVVLRPASKGTGVIAGGSVRAVVESAGISDILSKSLGSTNPVNVVRATIKALSQLRSAETVRQTRGLPPREPREPREAREPAGVAS